MVILGKRQTCPSKPTPRRTIRLDANTTSGVRQKTEDPQITEMGVNALCDHYENLVRSMIGLSKVGMEVEEVDQSRNSDQFPTRVSYLHLGFPSTDSFIRDLICTLESHY
jgi:hypothetical protein